MAELTRKQARKIILDAANVFRGAGMSKPYSMRSIQRAVRACRALRLVDSQVLVIAGYRPPKVIIRQPDTNTRERKRAERIARKKARREG